MSARSMRTTKRMMTKMATAAFALAAVFATPGCSAGEVDDEPGLARAQESELNARAAIVEAYRLGRHTGKTRTDDETRTVVYEYERGKLTFEKGKLAEVSFQAGARRVALHGPDAVAAAALFAGHRPTKLVDSECGEHSYVPTFEAYDANKEVLYFRYRDLEADANRPGAVKGGYILELAPIGESGRQSIRKVTLETGSMDSDPPSFGFDALRLAMQKGAGRFERVHYSLVPDPRGESLPTTQVRCLEFEEGAMTIDFHPRRGPSHSFVENGTCNVSASDGEILMQRAADDFEKNLCDSAGSPGDAR